MTESGSPGGGDQAVTPVSVQKSSRPNSAKPNLQKTDTPQPLLDVETEAELSTVTADPRSRTRRVVAAAATARDRTTAQVAALLIPLIKATRYPLLLVVLLAAVPAVTVMFLALLRPGPDDAFWLVLGFAGLVVAGWMALRRHQLLAVAVDRAALADALSSLISGRDMWEQVVQNVSVGRVGAAVVRKSRPLRILRGMWRGVQLTGILTEITDRPELIPLMPGRLRGLWFLGIACLISSAVLWLAVLLAGLVYLLGG